LLEHPNVTVMNTMDTTVPMHLRPPSTSPSEERMYPEDLELYRYFDDKGREITGYERAGDVYQDYGGGRPLFGHSPDFGYWYYGAIWYGDELWNGGRVGDYDGDGTSDEWDRLQFNDNELSMSQYQEWTPAKHPVYGDVEVGGWSPKFYRQNPPPELLEEWAIKEARFNLMLASQMPMVVMHDPVISEKDGEFSIEVELENKGLIPTALKQALLVKIVRPDTVSLEFPEEVLPRRSMSRGGFRGMGMGREGGEQPAPQEKVKVQLIEPSGMRPDIEIGRISGNSKVKVTFRLKLVDIESTDCTVKYSSTRGGVVSRDIVIEKN
jgi:hypothetical protein